jgi:hypothetical protein
VGSNLADECSSSGEATRNTRHWVNCGNRNPAKSGTIVIDFFGKIDVVGTIVELTGERFPVEPRDYFADCGRFFSKFGWRFAQVMT